MKGEWTTVYDRHPESPRVLFVTKEGLKFTQEQHAVLVFMKRLEKKIDRFLSATTDASTKGDGK